MSNLRLKGKLVDGVPTFDGFKIFIKRYNTILNFNTADAEYEINKWYEADLDGKKKIGGCDKFEYLAGFHLFLTKELADEYCKYYLTKNNLRDFIVLPIKFREIVEIGTIDEIKADGCSARWMMIPTQKITLSSLEVGQRFTKKDNLEITFIFMMKSVGIKIDEKYLYIHNNTIYGSSIDEEVVLV